MPLTCAEYATRLCLQQRPLQRLNGADIRLRRTPPYCHADARARQVDAAGGHDFALADQFVNPGATQHEDVHGFTASHSARDGIGADSCRGCERHERMTRRAFELRRQRDVCRCRPA